jgi:hypothetical protein
MNAAHFRFPLERNSALHQCRLNFHGISGSSASAEGDGGLPKVLHITCRQVACCSRVAAADAAAELLGAPEAARGRAEADAVGMVLSRDGCTKGAVCLRCAPERWLSNRGVLLAVSKPCALFDGLSDEEVRHVSPPCECGAQQPLHPPPPAPPFPMFDERGWPCCAPQILQVLARAVLPQPAWMAMDNVTAELLKISLDFTNRSRQLVRSLAPHQPPCYLALLHHPHHPHRSADPTDALC